MTQFGAVLALLGIGQTLVIMGGRGGIDLSVGSIHEPDGRSHGYAGERRDEHLACLHGLCMPRESCLGWPMDSWWLGWACRRSLRHSATSYIYSSVALGHHKRGACIGSARRLFAFIGQGQIVGIPAQVVLVVIPAFLVFSWLVTRTTFGRKVQMVGVNDVAANLVGINTRISSHRRCTGSAEHLPHWELS
jgi:ABC-type xylose transport system permease subunit